LAKQIKKKTISFISFILVFSMVFVGTVSAYASSIIDNQLQGCYTDVDINANPQSIGDKLNVRPPFIIAPLFSEANIFSKITGWVWVYSKVTVKGYDGYFTKITVNKTQETGYMLSICLSDDSARLLVRYANLFIGQTRNILKDYDNPQDFSWSVSKNNVISIDKKTGVVTAVNPGTVVVTARFNGQKTECVVSSINRWIEEETADAETDVVLKSSPTGSNYSVYDVITVSEGTELIAVGDTAQSNGQIYVKVKIGDGYKYGHIKLSDFPGIDYIMTQYHYYDKGYKLRYSDEGSKIKEYASVLDDVMMANFKLKVLSYINPYTSVADECKNESFGEVKPNNLASSCPQTSGHIRGSCLTTENIRSDLKSEFGDGAGNISKVAWTGHIMNNNERSNSDVGIGVVVMTPYGTIDTTSTKAREDRIYTLTHETGHQFGLYDHYCANDVSPITQKCSNKHCSLHYGDFIPHGCIMYERADIENSVYSKLYCNDCKENILNCIKDF